MIDYRDFRIMHRHDQGWEELKGPEHHDPAAHDPEQSWARGEPIYRCSCGEEVALVPPDETRPSQRPG